MYMINLTKVIYKNKICVHTKHVIILSKKPVNICSIEECVNVLLFLGIWIANGSRYKDAS